MIDRMDPSLPTVRLAMWRAAAIVLFDWLMSVDLNAVPVRHPARSRHLQICLLASNETDITGVTQEQIDAAREEVARDGVVKDGSARFAAR